MVVVSLDAYERLKAAGGHDWLGGGDQVRSKVHQGLAGQPPRPRKAALRETREDRVGHLVQVWV